MADAETEAEAEAEAGGETTDGAHEEGQWQYPPLILRLDLPDELRALIAWVEDVLVPALVRAVGRRPLASARGSSTQSSSSASTRRAGPAAADRPRHLRLHRPPVWRHVPVRNRPARRHHSERRRTMSAREAHHAAGEHGPRAPRGDRADGAPGGGQCLLWSGSWLVGDDAAGAEGVLQIRTQELRADYAAEVREQRQVIE